MDQGIGLSESIIVLTGHVHEDELLPHRVILRTHCRIEVLLQTSLQFLWEQTLGAFLHCQN